MKKAKCRIAVVLALAMLSILWGCGSKEETDAAKPGATANSNPNITAEKPQKFTAPPPPP